MTIKVEITYICDAEGCHDSETVEVDPGDTTDGDSNMPVGWGYDDDKFPLKLLCAEHYEEWQATQ